jgi:hypothetical protein
VLRAGDPAQPGAKDVLCKVEPKEAEEKAGHFKPQDSANATKGAQKASHAPAGGTRQLVRIRANLADFFFVIRRRSWPRGRLRHGYNKALASIFSGLRVGFSSRSFFGALLSDASSDAHSDAQFFPKLVRIHPHLKFSSGATERVSHILRCFPVAVVASQK